MATRTSPSFAGLTVPEDDSWKDPAYEPEGARFYEGQTAPLGLIHRLPSAPFEQNINIGGPGYTKETTQPFHQILNPQEQLAAENISAPSIPLGGFQLATMPPGAHMPMPFAYQPEIEKNITHELAPYSALPRMISDKSEGEPVSKWDIGEFGLDLLDVGLPLSFLGDFGTTALKLAPDIGRILPELSSMIAGVMPQQARKLLKGSKVVDTEGTPTRVYHGTQGVFSEFSPEYQDSSSMLGRGFYFTEAPEVAGGYAQSKGWRNTAGIYETGRPNVHANYLNLQKPLDMDGVAKEDVVTKMAEKIFAFDKDYPGFKMTNRYRHRLQELTRYIYNMKTDPIVRDVFPHTIDGMQKWEKVLAQASRDSDLIEELINNRQWDKAEEAITQFFKKSVRTNQDVFDAMTAGRTLPVPAPGTRISPWADRDAWTDGLEELGYDGITHIGSGGWGGNTFDPHRVWIVFDKKHIFPFAELEGMHKSPGALPPSGDFSKMLKDIFGKGMGR